MVNGVNPRTIQRSDIGKHVRRTCYEYPPECDPDGPPITPQVLYAISVAMTKVGPDAFGILIDMHGRIGVLVKSIMWPQDGKFTGVETFDTTMQLNSQWELD